MEIPQLNNSDILKDTIICVTGYINNDERKQHVLELLKKLKYENLKICYLTHSSYALNEISDIVDYVYFDKNNLLIKTSDYMDNLDLFDDSSYYYGVSTASIWQPFGEIKINFIAQHCPAVLSLLKDVINFSFINLFKWTILIDYDLTIPATGFRKFFEDKIKFLEQTNKKCLLYNRPTLDFIFPCIMFFQSEQLFSNDILMKHDWYKSTRNWIKHFKLGFSETITNKIFNDVYKNDIFYENISVDSKNYWGDDNYHNLTKFHFNVNQQDLNNIIKIFPYKKESGEFDFFIILINSIHKTLTIENLTIFNTNTKSIIFQLNNFEINGNCWYFNKLNQNLFNNDVLKLECKFNYDVDNYNLIEYYDLNFKDKIYKYITQLKFN